MTATGRPPLELQPFRHVDLARTARGTTWSASRSWKSTSSTRSSATASAWRPARPGPVANRPADRERRPRAGLESCGYAHDRINVFMGTATRQRYLETHPRYVELERTAIGVDAVELEKRTRLPEGTGVGGAIAARSAPPGRR